MEFNYEDMQLDYVKKKTKGEMLREGLQTLLEQIRNIIQALPWSCVVQH